MEQNRILKTQFLTYTSTDLASVSAEGLGKFLGVKPIYTSKEDLEMLKKVVESPHLSQWIKDNKMKKLVGNWCVLCGGISTKIAGYDYNWCN